MPFLYLLGVDELDDEETRILLEKEFDDFYEDQVHKSAGKVVLYLETKVFGTLFRVIFRFYEYFI